MDRNILRIDMDIKKYEDALNFITERLAYMYDINFIDINNIEKIEFIYKTNFSCKIYLKHNIKEIWIILMQSLLGSDYRKEVNTVINHYKYNMKYSNRLFDVKRYKGDDRSYYIKSADIFDITKCVIPYLLSKDRLKRYHS